jgi:hypothetical protein
MNPKPLNTKDNARSNQDEDVYTHAPVAKLLLGKQAEELVALACAKRPSPLRKRPQSIILARLAGLVVLGFRAGSPEFPE